MVTMPMPNRLLITFAAIQLLATSSATQAIGDDSVDQWLSRNHEPWQDELVGLWPEIDKMVAAMYPIAQSGNTRARITFAYYISLLTESPETSVLGMHSLADLREQAELWATDLSSNADIETANIAKLVLMNLGNPQTQPPTPDLLP
jgi:hypothetical protein